MDQFGLRTLDLPSDMIARSVLARYTQALDVGDHERLGSMFAVDAWYSVSVAGARAYGPLRGRDALIKHFIESSQTRTGRRRHFVSNCVVEDYKDSVMRFVAYLMVIALDKAAIELRTTGSYEVDLRVGQTTEIVGMDIQLDAQF